MLLRKLNSLLTKLGYNSLGCEKVEFSNGLILEDALRIIVNGFNEYITDESFEGIRYITCWNHQGDVKWSFNATKMPEYEIIFLIGRYF